MNHLHVKVCKTAANSGSETSGATGLEPNAANCKKNVEKFFFLFFDVWFFITQAPRQMVHQNSDNSAFSYSTTSVSRSLRDPPMPLSVLSQKQNRSTGLV